MAGKTLTFTRPDIHWGSVFEFIVDALIVIMAGNFAAKLLLKSDVPITDQFTEFLMVLALVAVVVKIVLATKIVKRRV